MDVKKNIRTFVLKSAVVSLIICTAILTWKVFSNPYVLHKDQINYGNEIIKQIDDYKKINKRLPVTLNDIKVEDTLEGSIYYERVSDYSYRLWFGTTLGESGTYDSMSKKWNIP